MRSARALAAIVATSAAFISVAAAPDTFYYRWIDKDGKTQFADKPPANFKGDVTKVLVDTPSDPVRPPPPATAAPPKAPVVEADEKAPDLATRRRTQRDLLQARLTTARQNLEVAKKALSDGEATTDGERQYVHQDFGRSERNPERTPPPRSNCMATQTSDGKNIWNCPRPIPNDAYFERQKTLEEAVRKAEDEVTEAERAYRRGTD